MSYRCDYDPDAALFLGAQSGDLTAVRQALDLGANPNASYGPLEERALTRAIRAGHLRAAEMLLDAGADPLALDRRGSHAPIAAVESSAVEALALLADRNVDLGRPGGFGFTPLMKAASGGFSAHVELLARHGVDLEARAQGGVTAAMLAARNRQLPSLQALARHGANLAARDAQGLSVLMHAVGLVDEPSLACVDFLVRHGADIHALDHQARDAAFLASIHGHGACVDFLKALSLRQELGLCAGPSLGSRAASRI